MTKREKILEIAEEIYLAGSVSGEHDALGARRGRSLMKKLDKVIQQAKEAINEK